MSEIIHSSQIIQRLPVPSPKEAINIRSGTMEDIPFIDSLQKKYSKKLAFLPTKALEGKIKADHVLIAETGGRLSSVAEDGANGSGSWGQLPSKVGYLIGQDQYFKRDDVGIIYHLAVDESKQRGFIGASLLKAQFEKSAYGCKLYCCWCAQDLEANHFYESMGFVPLAFRAGSEKKQRIHIFWEKRIKEGDTSTPWWFPFETKGGMMAADRLAFPIPLEKHWSNELPMIFPKDTHQEDEPKKLLVSRETKAVKKEIPPKRETRKTLRGLSFDVPVVETSKKEKPKREKKPKVKNDPKLARMARELKDRWLEQVNENPMCLESAGKYDLTKQLDSCPHPSPLPCVHGRGDQMKLLAA